RAGEIRIEQKTGLCGKRGLVSLRLEPRAKISGPPVLPDDCAMHGPSGGAVPNKRGLSLIGDADRHDVLGACAGIAHGALGGLERRRPQILRLVLDLAVSREMLRKLALSKRRDRGVGAEKNGPRRGRALVDRQHISGHALLPLLRLFRKTAAVGSTNECTEK